MILQRDSEKRLIEATSFRIFEDWFDGKVKNHKVSKS